MKRLAVAAVLATLAIVTYISPSNPALPESFDPELEVEDPNVLSAAGALYGTSNELLVYDVKDSTAFSNAFPDAYELYRVAELGRHPVEAHTLVIEWLSGDVVGKWDFTRGFYDLMLDSGVAALSEDDALKISKALATYGNYELRHPWEVVDSSDSDRLGMSISDPQAFLTPHGYQAELYTWSETNGVVAFWEVYYVDGLVSEAHWSVEGVARDPGNRSWEAVNLDESVCVYNWYEPHSRDMCGTPPDEIFDLDYTTVATSENFDDSTWVIEAADGATVNQTFADALASAGNWSYDWLVRTNGQDSTCSGTTNPNRSWGYHSRDPDCTLRIRLFPDDGLLCGACTMAVENDTTMYVAPDFVEYLEEDIEFYRNASHYGAADAARLLVGHLHHVETATTTPELLPDVNHTSPPGSFIRDRGRANGTLGPSHFALRAIHTDAYQNFRAAVQNTTGFNDVFPAPNGTETIQVVYQGEPPDSFPSDLLPQDWELEPRKNLTNVSLRNTTPAMYPEEGNITLINSSDPIPEDADGIRPGSLVVSSPSLVGCTANFIWNNTQNDTMYLGTAGHCLNETEGLSPHSQQSGLWVCIKNCSYEFTGSDYTTRECSERGSWYGSEPDPAAICTKINGELLELGPISFTECMNPNCVDDSGYEVANDAAFVEIPDDKTDLVDPSMPVWGGPYSSGDPCANSADYAFSNIDAGEPQGGQGGESQLADAKETPPDVPVLVTWYGNAQIVGEVWPTKARPGFFGWCTGNEFAEHARFRVIGPAFFGDSGGVVTHAYVDGSGTLRAGEALGHWTTLGGGGTVATYAQSMADDYSIPAEVVTVSDSLR